MTVLSSASRVTLVGNGVARVWPFAFRVVDPAHLQVILTSPAGAETRLTDGYTVALAGAGGSVTYPTSGAPLASGWRITLRRLVPLTQESAFANQGGFYANAHEERFDLLAMADQQQQEQLDRAILAPVSDDVPFLLPTASARAGRLLAFEEDGAPASTTVTAAQVDAVIRAGLADGKVLIEIPPFTGDGVTTSFDTGVPLDTAVCVDAVVGGVPQRADAYTIAGTSVTFAEAPPADVDIIIRLIAAVDALNAVTSVAGKSGAVVLVVADVSGLQAALDARQPLAATLTALASRSIGVASSTDIPDRSAADARYAASAHAHAASDITSGTLALARLPVADSGENSGTELVRADDSRLSDARTPSAHTQTASTITDFSEAVDDRVAALLVAGANITLTYDDVAGSLTVASSGGGSFTAATASEAATGTDNTKGVTPLALEGWASALTELTSGQIDTAADFIPVYDVSGTKMKKVKPANLGIGGSAGGGVPLAMGWSPTDKATNATLSNNRMTVVSTQYDGVRSTIAHGNGTAVAELTFAAKSTTNARPTLGLCRADQNLSGLLTSTHLCAYYGLNGHVYLYGTSQGVFGSYDVGTIITICADFDLGKAWILRNGASLTGDPATKTGGFDLSGGAHYLFAATGDGGTSESTTVILNTGTSAFSHAPASGFILGW